MSPSLISGLIAIAVVVVVAMMMRRNSTDEAATPTPRPQLSREPYGDGGVAVMEADPDAEDDDEADDADDSHVAAVTSDGEAFVAYRHAVLMIPPEESGEAWKVGAGMKASNMRGEQALGMVWQAGDWTGARIVRGGADEGPWRLEGLGRDGEYTAFGFESREGAEAAKQLFERIGVVRLGMDEDGNPAPPSAEQFEEARRIYEETSAALDMPDEDPR